MDNRRVRRIFLRLDEKWITIGPKGSSGKKHGVHVLIDDDGKIVKGPKDLVNQNVNNIQTSNKAKSEGALGKMSSKNTPEEWKSWLDEAPVGTSVVKYSDDYSKTLSEYMKNNKGEWRNVSDDRTIAEFMNTADLAKALTGGGKVSVKNMKGEKWNVNSKGVEKQKTRGYSLADAYKKAGIKVDPKKLEEAKKIMPDYLEFDEPELREYVNHIYAGYDLPIKILRKMNVYKNLDRKRQKALSNYGYTHEKADERKDLQKKIGARFLKNGAWSGKKKNKSGKDVDTYKGEVKKGHKAVIVIGYPAAGKSSKIVNGLSQKEGMFVLDSDAIKEMFPEFKKSHGAAVSCINKEANMVRSDVINEFKRGGSREGDNIIIPIIGETNEAVERYIKELAPSGYDIEIQYKRAPIETSASRMVSRAAETGRIIPLKALDETKNPEDVFEHFKGLTNDKGLPYVRTEAK